MKKKKIIIISLVLIILIALCILFISKNNNNLDSDNDSINIVAKNNNIEDVSFEGMETVSINLSSTLKITEGGIYNLTGTISDGNIYIDTKDNVKLILNGVTINSSDGPAINIENANVVHIELASGTVNYLIDTETYSDSNINGTLFSKGDLIIGGDGKLVIDANYEDGIVSKDNLKIISGEFEIESVDDGIRGKDSVVIMNGNFKINASGDAIKSTNDTDYNLGYILINDGTYDLETKLDGIQAETDLVINNGTFNIKTSGNDTDSSKGLKADSNLIINDGNFEIDSYDDSIHSNNYINIKNGSFSLSSGDDAIHADNKIVIDNGNIDVLKSYEGIEASEIIINDGDINIVASDDGINAASKSSSNDNNDFSKNMPDDMKDLSNKPENMENFDPKDGNKPNENMDNFNPVNDNKPEDMEDFDPKDGNRPEDMENFDPKNGNKPDKNMEDFDPTSNDKPADNNIKPNFEDIGVNNDSDIATITINGGSIYVNANGDGVDANGSIYMNGGKLIINGPTDNGNGVLDYDKEFKITGGILVASGSSGMALNTSNNSTQNSIMINFSEVINSSELISIFDSNNNEIFTYSSSKKYQNIVISIPDLKKGETYTIYKGGSTNSVEDSGLYETGSYTGGSKYEEFTIENNVNSIGNTKNSFNPMTEFRKNK